MSWITFCAWFFGPSTAWLLIRYALVESPMTATYPVRESKSLACPKQALPPPGMG